MTKRERNVQRLIRFTKLENDYLTRKIEQSQLETFQLYAHTMLLQGEVINVDYSPLNNLIKEVKRIGININQVTKLANQFTDISAKDIQNLTQQLTNLTQLVETSLKDEISHHSKETEVDYFGVYKALSNQDV